VHFHKHGFLKKFCYLGLLIGQLLSSKVLIHFQISSQNKTTKSVEKAMSDVKSLTANVNNLTSSNISDAAKILLSLSEIDPNKANVRISLRFKKCSVFTKNMLD